MSPQRFLHPATITFGAAVRAERQRQGWTIEYLSAMTNYDVTAQMLGLFERGDRQCSLSQAIVVADALGVPLSELVEQDLGPDTRAHQLGSDVLAVLARHGVVDLQEAS